MEVSGETKFGEGHKTAQKRQNPAKHACMYVCMYVCM